MMDKFLWELFFKTGDLRYYIFLKEMEKCDQDEDREVKGNNN